MSLVPFQCVCGEAREGLGGAVGGNWVTLIKSCEFSLCSRVCRSQKCLCSLTQEGHMCTAFGTDE